MGGGGGVLSRSLKCRAIVGEAHVRVRVCVLVCGGVRACVLVYVPMCTCVCVHACMCVQPIVSGTSHSPFSQFFPSKPFLQSQKYFPSPSTHFAPF